MFDYNNVKADGQSVMEYATEWSMMWWCAVNKLLTYSLESFTRIVTHYSLGLCRPKLNSSLYAALDQDIDIDRPTQLRCLCPQNLPPALRPRAQPLGGWGSGSPKIWTDHPDFLRSCRL